MADKMLINGLIKFCDAKSKNIKLKAEPQVFIEIRQALEELKAIKQWKSDVMEGFCKYDASSFEEIVVNARAKAIDEFAEAITAKLPKVEKDERVSKMACVADMIFLVDGVAGQMKAGGIE